MVQQKVTSEKVVQPHFERVTVTPGSLGKRYRLLGIEDGVLNRPIRADRPKGMARQWKAEEGNGSFLVLWDRGDHFSILDGQHRITAASEHLEGGAEFGAIIYPPDAFPGGPRALLSVLDGGYNGVAQKNSDRIRARAAMSAWPAIFRDYGLEFGYDRSRSRIVWDAVILARLRADYSHSVERVVTNMARGNAIKSGGERVGLVSAWESYPEKDIRRTAETLAWWTPIAAEVYQRYHAGVLGTSAGIQFALLLRECNPSGLGAVTGFADKVLSSGRGIHSPPSVAGAGSKSNLAAIEHLLTIANYRRLQEHRASIYNIRSDV